MLLKDAWKAGVMMIAALAIIPPVSAQPIPAKAQNACIQRTAEAMVVAARDIEVTRGGPVDALKGTQTLFMRNRATGQTAECKVNTIDGHVVSVQLTSQPNRPPQAVPQASIDACIQRTAEELVVQARNIEFVSAGPADNGGVRTLTMRDRTTSRTAQCRVNTNTHTVLSVSATSPKPPTSTGRPVAPNDPNARSCHAAIGRKIRQEFGGVQKVTFISDTTQAFFISNAQEGIRGEGQFSQGSANSHRFNYNCTVNKRSGRVERSSYSLIR